MKDSLSLIPRPLLDSLGTSLGWSENETQRTPVLTLTTPTRMHTTDPPAQAQGFLLGTAGYSPQLQQQDSKHSVRGRPHRSTDDPLWVSCSLDE